MSKLEIHPICESFPNMDDAQYQRLKESIAKYKRIRFPIVLFEGKILDGRHRYRACGELGIKLKDKDFEEYTGTSPQEYAELLNDHRRHYTASQLSARIAKVTVVENYTTAQTTERSAGKFIPNEKSIQKLADKAGVSRSSVEKAKKVLKDAPDAFDSIMSGKKTVCQVEKEIAARKKKETPQLTFIEQKKAEAKRLFDIIRELHSIGAELEAICQTPIGSEMHQQTVSKHIGELKSHIKLSLPFAECPYCKGRKCKTCHMLGWLIKSVYDNLPREFKQ